MSLIILSQKEFASEGDKVPQISSNGTNGFPCCYFTGGPILYLTTYENLVCNKRCNLIGIPLNWNAQLPIVCVFSCSTT